MAEGISVSLFLWKTSCDIKLLQMLPKTMKYIMMAPNELDSNIMLIKNIEALPATKYPRSYKESKLPGTISLILK